MKTRVNSIVLAAAFAVCAAVPKVCAAPAWQTAAEPFDPRIQRMAGLNFLVFPDKDHKWPRLAVRTQFDAGRHYCPDPPHASHYGLNFNPVDLGMILPEAGAEPELVACERTWSGTALSLAYREEGWSDDEEFSFEITASRLSPGVLVKSGSDFLLLFAGLKRMGERPEGAPASGAGHDRIPAFYAAKTGGDTAIRALEDVAELPLAGLSSGWLLAWYGDETFFQAMRHSGIVVSGAGGDWGEEIWDKTAYKADCPMLILFASDPSGLEQTEDRDALCVSGVNKLIVMPLMGDRFPAAAETAKWTAGLPEDVVARCDWWAGHAAKYPIGAMESYSYDAKTDTATIAAEFEFEDFRDSGEPAAPVAPVFATAHLTGFAAMGFSKQPHDPGLLTSVGPYMAVPGCESYEIRFSGLGKYAAPRPEPGPQRPEHLVKDLREQVAKIAEAGHLAPVELRSKTGAGWGSGRNPPGKYGEVYNTPGEILYFLAESLPFLDEALREKTLEYMRRERSEYPPEKLQKLLFWDGTRRECNPPRESFRSAVPPIGEQFAKPGEPLHGMAMYWLASYYAAAGADGLDTAWPGIRAARDPWLRRLDWATGACFQWPGSVNWNTGGRDARRILGRNWDMLGGVVDANHAFAASVGQVRLARQAGDNDFEAEGWGLLARAAAQRFSYATLLDYLYKTGTFLPRPGWESANEDTRVPFIVDEFGVTFAMKRDEGHGGPRIGPQLSGPWYSYHGRLLPLGDITPELGMFLGEHAADYSRPYFQAFEYNIPNWFLACLESTVNFESNFAHPMDAYQAFMGHAFVFGGEPQWLEKHADLPWWPRGDLYYLGKIIETLRAYAR